MLNKMLKWRKKNSKGFSLVELIIVIAIMAILVGILAPQFIKYVAKSRVSADKTSIQEVITAIQTYYADAENPVPADNTYTLSLTGSSADVTSGVIGDVLIEAGITKTPALKTGHTVTVTLKVASGKIDVTTSPTLDKYS